MRGRNFGLIALAAASLTLAACGDRAGHEKTPRSAGERIAAALDPCAEDRGAFAQNVCKNEALAALDGQVSQTLVAQAANVSDAGAQLLVQNQQRWLETQRVACGVIDPDAPPTGEQQTCLEAKLRQRAQEAANAVQEVGGYTFQRVEITDAAPVTAEIASDTGLGDAAPAAVTRDVRFPRIDGAASPIIQRFNELVAQQPRFRLEDATNETTNYSIAYAGPELVSVRFDYADDTLGAGRGNSDTRAVNVVMTTGQPLTAENVFRAGSGWQDFITARAVRDITAQYRNDYPGFAPPERDVHETATKPHLWLIKEEGLVLLFPPLSFGGSYDMVGTEVAIPWADLRRYLNPTAPLPIRAQA